MWIFGVCTYSRRFFRGSWEIKHTGEEFELERERIQKGGVLCVIETGTISLGR